MTKERYLDRVRMSLGAKNLERILAGCVCLRCYCTDPGCPGWALVLNNLHSICEHMAGRGRDPAYSDRRIVKSTAPIINDGDQAGK